MYRRFIQQFNSLKRSEKTHIHTYIYIETEEEQKSNAKLMVWITNEMYHFALAKPFAKEAESLARRGVSASSLQHGRKKLPATILLVFLERGSSPVAPCEKDGVAQSGAGDDRGELILRPRLEFWFRYSKFNHDAILRDFAFRASSNVF